MIRKKKTKPSLFTEGMMVSLKILNNDVEEQPLELINRFIRVIRYKVNY